MIHEQPQSPAAAAPPELAEAAAKLRVLTGQLMRRLRAASEGEGVTLSQAAVLSRLDRHGPATTVALARAERVRPQSMGATVGALEEEGLVQRSPHPTDRRQAIMSLTDKGRRQLTEVRRTREGWIAQALGERLDEREQAVVIEALDLLARLAEDEA
ncbi:MULTISPECIES: MarR family winged helix-turn-helix transcriptional regulator [Streptomyces]|uniref:MarR family winged helix-turn-helix transcriptional regulator n=1 Tax=Streptomyces TaxID=1883 RepID=UPI001990792C|nr:MULTISPECIES: MarR family transcriptional regulator [Streptomyces]MCC2275888.1 MarR family transcriptional regulator [Streptomyces sp. ET3-23]GHF05769.1 MarR family transcriptional regulator [Streptomyces morookaense]